MKWSEILRLTVFAGAVALAAGCSDDKTDYSTEVAFRDGDGMYVVSAAGGAHDVTFYSQCGHWEIAVPEGVGEWLDVWPLFGDDNGKTTFKVARLERAYDRTATLDIVTERGVVGQIRVRQQGAAPEMRFDLLSNHIRADYQGTPVVVNVTANFDWEADIRPAAGEGPVTWLTLGETTPTSQQFLFSDNTGQPKRECTVRFRMTGGTHYVDLPVTQRAGDNVYERAEHITVAELLDKVSLDGSGAWEIEDNYAVDGWVISDFRHKNLPDSVLWVQDGSGRGLKLLLKDKQDFLDPPAERAGWYDCGSRLSLHLCGLEFRRDKEGNLAICDFPASVVMARGEEPASRLAVARPDFSDLDKWVNTLVAVDPVEFVFTYGCYTNYWEVAAQSIDKVEELWKNDVPAAYKATYTDFHHYPQLLRDRTGRIAKALFSCDFTQALSKNIPQGRGPLRGIVTLYGGEPVIQLRDSDDDKLPATGDRTATTLVKGGPWRDVTRTEAAFEAGNDGGDRTQIVFSLRNSVWENDGIAPQSSVDGTKITSGMYWLSAAIRYDHAKKYAAADENRYLSLNAMNWWNGTGSVLSNVHDSGEGFILRTNALRNATGDLWLSFSTTSSLGGPGELKIQWAESDAEDLTGVAFTDVATYDAPVLDYTPYLMPYSVRLPDAMKGKENVVILFRCASKVNAKRGGEVVATGTNRLGSIEIVEIK